MTENEERMLNALEAIREWYWGLDLDPEVDMPEETLDAMREAIRAATEQLSPVREEAP